MKYAVVGAVVFSLALIALGVIRGVVWSINYHLERFNPWWSR